MKLEIKDLVSYLPYGLNIKDVKHGSVFEALHFITTPHQDFSLFKGNLDQLINDKYLKPVLFPLSSLTKEINFNGETFVPIEWFEIGDSTNDSLEYEHGNIKLIRSLESLSKNEFVNDINYFPFGVIQKLIEWKFDVYGLIENGLAEPVTEDFNPYK